MTRKMKDSGVEWIGEIPENWETRRLKNGLRKKKVIIKKYDNQPILSLTMNGVSLRDLVNPKGKMPTTFDGYQEITPGNIIECLFDIDVTPRCVGIARDYGLTSPAYTQFEVINDFDADFIYYYLLMLDNDKILVPISKSLRNTITSDEFLILPFSFPPVEEQRRISNRISTETARINSIISETQQSINELKKYKQALITEAVTKGLDKNAEMKDSGIEWIGKISSTFQLPKLGSVTLKIGSGKTPSGGESVYVPEGILFLRSQNIYDEGLEISSPRFISEEIDEQMSGTRVMQGDVLLNITGGSIGRSTVYTLNQPANVNQHVCIIRTSEETLLPEWLNLCLMSNIGKQSVLFFQTGGNREGLNFADISKIRIPLPTLSTQKEIIRYLSGKLQHIQVLINQKEEAVKVYSEYKNSLIYEYVTGKKEA
ncbi:restriction endonuclease subunit S [Enterococcus faecium]|uniref:restriction endonuclease subunit S n=1 Tax=Enterococcus faecium TaxID=1352 RepID=UPI0021586CD9|nr:restriction endonuclease subunit S [Enterococcus faecium]